MTLYLPSFLAIINSFIFLTIAFIHFYWAFGGKWAADKVIPKTKEGVLTFTPPLIATIGVAIGLIFVALVLLSYIGLFTLPISISYLRIILWLITFIFLARAIGDFNYVGFTRKITNTLFAINDRKLFTPLCLFIAIVNLLILLL